jgi:formate dehydrogenase beta subunit
VSEEGQAIFSSWKGAIIDNRGKPDKAIPEGVALPVPRQYDKARGMLAFMGWDGLVVFDESVNVVDLARGYMKAVQRYSCGRCIPCRVGTRVMLEILERIREGHGREGDLESLERLGRNVKESSKCQVGQTGTVAVLDTLKYYRDDYVKAIEEGKALETREYKTHLTAPCMDACPVHLDVPAYIECVKDRKFGESYRVIRNRNALPGVCGRVCVRPCESNCRRLNVDETLNIRLIKRFACDYSYGLGLQKEDGPKEFKGEKVAIIGAGPAGIAAAYYLGLRGYGVTVFEELPEPGGMAAVGIPDYRLPREDLKDDIRPIEDLGVEIRYGQAVGKDVSLEQLQQQGYKAVFVGVGAKNSRKMGVEGEDEKYEGFVHGVTFLRDLNLGREVYKAKRIVVVGGGNVAIDCVRSALRLGFTEVNLVYRRSRAEMPADPVEIEDAETEGIDFHFLTLPTKIIAEGGKVVGVECVRMELGEPDSSGRRRPIPIEGSEFFIETDVVIPAIGQEPDLALLEAAQDIEVTKWKTVVVDPDCLQTNREGVFSGGDCVTGPATLVEALAAGADAAIAIENYLAQGKMELPDYRKMEKLISRVGVYDDSEKVQVVGGVARPKAEHLPVASRIKTFDEVEKGLSAGAAIEDSLRCLRCYRVALVAV